MLIGVEIRNGGNVWLYFCIGFCVKKFSSLFEGEFNIFEWLYDCIIDFGSICLFDVVNYCILC